MQSFAYPVFNEALWKEKVNRFSFLFALGIVYSLIRLVSVDFQVSSIEVIYRFLSGWTVVAMLCLLLEATLATIVKIAVTPGCLLNSKLSVLKVFPKTIAATIKSNFEVYKPCTSYYRVPNTGYIVLGGDGYISPSYLPSYSVFPDNFQ
jgi:hypothetical protein